MEIKDTISIYYFLGNLSWFGVIAFFILLSLIIAYIIITILDKLFEPHHKRAKKNITLLIVCVIISCGLTLKIEADSTIRSLINSNSIKSYLIEKKLKYRSLKGLAEDIPFGANDSCKSEECIQVKINKIRKIVSDHPNEFIITPVNEDWNNKAEGVGIIDEKATRIIDSSIEKMLPLYESEIIQYMAKNTKDSLTYDFIITNIDGRCNENTLDMVIINSKGKLFPATRSIPAVLSKEYIPKKIISP